MPLLACRRFVLGLGLGLAGAASAALVAQPSLAAEPAADLVAGTFAQGVQIVKANPPGPARTAAILQVLQTKFDLVQMGQTSLGANWNKASEAERARFLKAAAAAEARSYSDRFGQYAGQTLTVGKVTSRPNGVFNVESTLNQSNGQPVKLIWEVRNSAQGLRITDVKIEGVSMIMTRRSDFNSYIQNNGGTVEPLIRELETRATR